MSTAAAAVIALACSSPTAQASASAIIGFTKPYVPTACGDATRRSQVYAANAITVPQITRNATAAAALGVTSTGDQPAVSPVTMLPATTNTPPAASCIAVDWSAGASASP